MCANPDLFYSLFIHLEIYVSMCLNISLADLADRADFFMLCA